MATFLIIVAMLLALVAIAGCILPGLPGTPFAFIGVIILHFVDKTDKFEISTLILLGVLTVLSLLVDYVMPMLGAKKFGGSKYGSFGAVAGLIIGLFIPIPGTIILGPLVGAVLGELYNQKALPDATKAGLGAILGMFAGSVLKLVFTGIIVYFMFENVFS